MTTTPGPIPLTVITLYCRTTEQQCEHYREMNVGATCYYDGSRAVYSHDYTGAEIPREVRRFIRRFDAGQPVKPFAFELEGER